METSSDRRLVSLETHNENFRIARTKFLSTLVPLKCNRGFAAHAFDLSSGNYLGTMQDGKGNNISIDGLWGLQWGNGGSGGEAATLYFAAAPAGGAHGLFGSLKPMADSALQ